MCARCEAPSAVAALALSAVNESSLLLTWNASTDRTACAYIYSVCVYVQSAGSSCANQSPTETVSGALSGVLCIAHNSYVIYCTEL